jgi:aerobic carbon-monoxide dehydrogenase large subunit
MDSRIAGMRRMPDNRRSRTRAQDAGLFDLSNSVNPVNGSSRKAAMSDAHAHPFNGRVEDRRLITGSGKYAADWSLPGQLYAAFVRSDRAHAEIVSVDTAKAAAFPGVKRVYTGADAVAAGYTKYFVLVNYPGRDGKHILKPPRPMLAASRVRHVGEALAMVVAESAHAAQDAAELVEVEYRDLPHVVSAEEALAPGAPLLHEEAPGNLAFDYEAGSEESVKTAFAQAAHVARLKLEVTRVAPNPMELRGCTVRYDAADGTYHVHVCIQGVLMMRRQLSAITDVPEDKIVVHAQDIGGSFGQRSSAYPEYCMQMLASKELGRPVRWISSRSEGFLTDFHGRGNTVNGELALDAEGRFLALRLDWIADMGAYLSPTGSASHTRNPATCMTGVYRIPALYGRFRLAFTNTMPVAAYRGAGRPDIAYVVERLVNEAAFQLKMDPAELRRRNFIPREAFPYKTPTGSTYEPTDLHGVLDRALKFADWKGFSARRRQSEKAGKLRGRGIATVIENSGAGMFPKDQVEIDAGASGILEVFSMSQSQGQGHETAFAEVVARELGIEATRVRIRQGVRLLIGNHTGGSRSAVGAGSACKLAAQKLIEQGRSLAAEQLEVEPSQVDYAKGVFQVRGGRKKIGLFQLAKKKPFTAMGEGTFLSTFPNGCHITEVEIDPATGVTEIVAYNAVDDCGNVINHTIVEGQVHGAVAQGAGQIFGEHVVYDRDTGQLLTGSFMDYYMPRAGLVPGIRMQDAPLPSTANALGVKGVGESGCTASIPSLTNAVLDALQPLGVQHLDMPLTPAKLWHAIQAAKRQ